MSRFWFLAKMFSVKSFIFCLFMTVTDGGKKLLVEYIPPESCDLDPTMNPKDCTDTGRISVHIETSNALPDNVSCIVWYGEKDRFQVTCRDGVLIFSSLEATDTEKSLLRRKTKATTSTAFEIEHSRRVKRDHEDSVAVAAVVGSVLGPIGSLGGALLCWLLCHHNDPPPPNKPPSISQHAALTTAQPIMAGEGKKTVNVTWVPPKVTDPEDGNIEIVTSPSNFKNGGEYSEGTFVVYFSGIDSGGLPATDHLSFQVQVDRCGFPSWPDNGYIECSDNDIVYGTTCNVSCKPGYTRDESDTNSLKCGKGGKWIPSVQLNCKPKACAKVPSILHGEIQCLRNEIVYDNMCEVVCNDGFQVHGTRLMECDTDGNWGSRPVCTDVLPPRFLSGECPNDMQVYIDSTNNTAKVSWEEPNGEDNSKETVTITEIHGHKPGQRFEAGSHTIKYTIEDEEQNKGDSCVFSIQVLSNSCSPPNLQVTGGEHLKYDCPNSYILGAECSLACKSGYPMGGVDRIQCLSDKTSYPPKLDWKWEVGGLAPFCKETNCSRDALNEPINGALACSQWTHGQMCQMQCNNGYDIPNIGDGLYVCGRSTGKWRPSSRVPNCNTKIDANNMHLPNEFYYYTGECNSSTENMNQIKENFVQALNSSKFLEECVGVPECQAKFVDVTCGPISSRRKRDLNSHFYKRSVSAFAYTLLFEFILPYKLVAGKTPDDIFAENENSLYKMSDVIQKETDAGHFDLHVGDLRVESDSYVPANPSMICPSGTIPRRESASCVGCPKGHYTTMVGSCVECPIGTYQNSTNSLQCEPCPPNTNTTDSGTENITQCLEYCAEGAFSPDTLAPCTKCPSSSYQPSTKSVSCIRCESNKRSTSDGATSKSQCKEYDVQLNQIKSKIANKMTHDIITLFMWIYISNTTKDAAVEIENTASHSKLSLSFTPTITIKQSGKDVNSGQTIQSAAWTNVAFSIDKPSNEIIVYINGEAFYKNASFVVSKSHILEPNDLIGLYGDVKISAFSVVSRKVSPSNVTAWSTTCSPSISGTIFSMDDLAEANGVKLVIPSVCDAVNECEGSPCGIHKCINKLGSYECLCTGGFSGRQCQIAPDYCKNNNCMNGATCVNGTGNYTCKCPYGYNGRMCEIKAVDGGWSAWTNWTSCSKSCDSGIATRTRRCDSPPPDSEGKHCIGNTTETKSCKEEKCPECSKLRKTYGLIIRCNETSELRRCSITCTAGLYFTNPPLPYYECGVATGYKWNHQNEKNPTGRLPSCSELVPPVEIGVYFDGYYDSMPCTSNNMKAIKDSIETKLSFIDCKKNGTCKTTIHEPDCVNSATGSSMNLTIGVHASINSKEGSFNVAELLQNKSAPSNELTDFARQTLEVERSAQSIMNNSIDFFQVTIDETNYSLASGTSSLTYRPDIKCPNGTVRIEVFCALCAVGSYSDGRICVMCPRGQYQDTKRQPTCKQCPSGKTTVGIGSIYVSECSVMDNFPVGSSSANKDAFLIGVGVSLSIALLILAAVGVILACKHLGKRKKSVKDSHFDLHTTGFSDMPSLPVFEKQQLTFMPDRKL